MDDHATRTLVSQLAEDLGWLEQHCRHQPEQAAQAGHLRLAAALVRNCVGPFLDDQPPTPLHLAVVGGAGTGKSTVVNLLTGAGAAEANPQAGFTRHPVAYTNVNGALRWPAHLGFLAPLNRLPEPGPSNLDEDVYQIRRVAHDPLSAGLLKDFVIWDCPDMTTWAATGYVPRLLEIAGLADVVIYVASDERYNDEVPTQFLHQLLQAGKPVVVCLVKMKEADAPALVAHFQRDVLGKLSQEALACLAIPHLSPAQLADPAGQAGRFRIPLLNQAAVLGEPPVAARRRVVRGAVHYLVANQEQLLGSARQDVAALEGWRSVVQEGMVEFNGRYRREFLMGERFHSFDEALVRLLELLELPGVGRFVSGVLWTVRLPYRALMSWIGKRLKRPEAPDLSQQAVMEGALTAWLDLLRKEAVRRADTHSLWAHIQKGFASGLTDQARERFEQGFRNFQLSLADEVDRTARAIYEELEKSPVRLNVLRGGKFTLDLAGIVSAVALGHTVVQDAVFAVVATWITQQLVELLGIQYVDNQRELARQRQELLVMQCVSGPLAEWLVQWPATGGSTFERLQLALRRIPPAVQQLSKLVLRP
jgi:hypothetical protein